MSNIKGSNPVKPKSELQCPSCGGHKFIEKLGGYVCKKCRRFIDKAIVNRNKLIVSK